MNRISKEAGATAAAARTFTRRTLLKAGAAGVALAAAGPWPVRDARSSSGELNWFTWDDYNQKPLLEKFSADTGIKLNVQVFPGNEEALNKLRTSTEGIDLASPGLHWINAGLEYDLYQPLDLGKLKNVGKIEKSLFDRVETLGATDKGQTYALPLSWSTEALAAVGSIPLDYGKASYGLIWEPQYAGKVMVRARSALLATGLWLEATGKIEPGTFRKAYADETVMKAAYGQALDYAIAHKSQIKQFWKSGGDQKTALLQNGVQIGLAWDSVIYSLIKDGGDFKFLAGTEGALTVMDSNAVVKGAKNVEQAYALIDWILDPANGAVMTNNVGYNAVSTGAEAGYGPDYQKFFAAAYPGDAIAKLFVQGPEKAWFLAARQPFVDKFLAA